MSESLAEFFRNFEMAINESPYKDILLSYNPDDPVWSGYSRMYISEIQNESIEFKMLEALLDVIHILISQGYSFYDLIT